MEVVQDRGAEYEMIQDGATSSSMNEDGQAMDYSALDSQPEQGEEEEVYEVTMEEYGPEETIDEPFTEGEMVDATPSNEEEEEQDEEEMMNDDAQNEQDYGDEGEAIAELSTEAIEEGAAQLVTPTNGVEEEGAVLPAPTESEEPAQAATGKEEEAAKAAEASESKEGQKVTEELPYNETTLGSAVVSLADAHETGEEEEAHPDDTEAIANDPEEGEEVHAPPSVRVTFNGQDFVLFPHSEPSTYISAQQGEVVAAPRLKADSSLFYESMDSLFEALRVKDSLGDFLEEGTELQVNFIDLQLVLREDDIYAREVSLNDLHRLHLGLGLTSSLHLVVSESPRFITRYNELAAHATTIFDQAANQTADAESAEQQEDEEVEQPHEEAHGQEEGYNDEETEQGNEEEREGGDPRPDDEEQANTLEEQLPGDPNEEVEDAEAEGSYKEGEDAEAEEYEQGTLSLNAAEVASLEASVPHQNYEEDGQEAEGEDIVDYDEAYHSDGVKSGDGDAEYDAEEQGETQQEEESYEDNPLRQKRSLDEGDDDIENTESNEGESKRVKVDVE